MVRGVAALVSCLAAGCFFTPDRPDGMTTQQDAALDAVDAPIDAHVVTQDAEMPCMIRLVDNFNPNGAADPCEGWGSQTVTRSQIERRLGKLDMVLQSHFSGATATCLSDTPVQQVNGVVVGMDPGTLLIRTGTVMYVSVIPTPGSELTIRLENNGAGQKLVMFDAAGSLGERNYVAAEMSHVKLAAAGVVVVGYYGPTQLGPWTMLGTKQLTGSFPSDFFVQLAAATTQSGGTARFDDLVAYQCP